MRRVLLSVIPLALALAACGDEKLPGTDAGADLPVLDTANGRDTAVADMAADPGAADPGVVDPGQADTPPIDTPVADPGPADAGPDLTPDETSPEVVATTPTDQQGGVALPFTITITFSEAIYAATIAPQTVKVFDPKGKEVAGTRTVAGAVVTFTPADPTALVHASPYRVWLTGGIIADLAGNKMLEQFEFSFFTADYSNLAAYETVAKAYSPKIYAVTGDMATPQVMVPTRFDADGDWDGSNNREWVLQTTSVTPAVYYSVVETPSHYFIHYMYFFPWLNHTGFAHANGAAGAFVLVEKAHTGVSERPVAVTLYYKESLVEENTAFATAESGLYGSKSLDFYGFEASYSQAQLFPDGHYEAYLSPGDHESCLWIREDQPLQCQLESAQKPFVNKLVLAYTDGTPTVFKKQGTAWPKDMGDITDAPQVLGYELVPLTSSLWPRRGNVGADKVYSAEYKYVAGDARPGNNADLPSSFVDPFDPVDTAFGRPPWAWRFNPASGGGFAGIEQGWIGVDPAWYVWSRHWSVDQDTVIIDYDPSSGAGFAVEYCFNPYLDIDVRTTDLKCAP
jgi:hypothetical protein